MSRAMDDLAAEFARALEDYLGGGGETALRRAYELGRHALAQGAGLLDILAAYQTAFAAMLTQRNDRSGPDQMSQRLLPVLAESLSPFEMVLRGFQEANEQLRRSLAELSRMQEELRGQNQQLQAVHAEVEAERRRYRQLFEFAPDGYLVTDLQGVIREANSAAAILLGTPTGHLAGRTLTEFVLAADRKEFREQLRRFQNGEAERKEDWQVSLQAGNSPVVPVALTADVEFDASHQLAGLRWLVRDATGQRRAEEERAQSLLGRAEAEAARRIAFLADASAQLAGSLGDKTTLAGVARLSVPYLADWCIIHVTDLDGSLLQVEVACADPGHADLAEMVKQHLQSAAGKATVPAWLAEHTPRILGSVSEVWLERLAGGTEFLDLVSRMGITSAIIVPLTVHDVRLGTLSLMSAGSGRRFLPVELALAEDLGRRCALALENARLYREMMRERDIADRANRSKDEFLAVLSHELRNPLMPVVGWTRILSGHSAIRNDPVLTEGVRALERNAQTLNRLVGDCLDLARISEGKIAMDEVAVDLDRVLLASVESVREKAQSKQVKLVLDLCAGPVWVTGDPARLQQVAMNLLVNAVKCTGAGGSVTLRSTHRNERAEFEVQDTGIGIEPALLEQIFQPFHQGTGLSPATDSGLGLGLTIARRIVDLHGGRIRAESAGVGSGSIFRVWLPLTPGSEMAVPTDALPLTDEGLVALRVLVVEDARDILFLLRVELERLGFLVQGAADGQQALHMALREKPDAIVSDIKMPGLDGYELIRRIRSTPELRNVPAIALTGFGRKGDVEKALAAGFEACLTKPARTEELAACIRRLIGEHGGQNPPARETRMQ